MKKVLSFSIGERYSDYTAYINAKNRKLSEIIGEIAKRNIRDGVVKVYNFNPNLSQSFDGTAGLVLLENLNTSIDISFEVETTADISVRIQRESRPRLYDPEVYTLEPKHIEKFAIYLGRLDKVIPDNVNRIDYDYLMLMPFYLYTSRGNLNIKPDLFYNILKQVYMRIFGDTENSAIERLKKIFNTIYKKTENKFFIGSIDTKAGVLKEIKIIAYSDRISNDNSDKKIYNFLSHLDTYFKNNIKNFNNATIAFLSPFYWPLIDNVEKLRAIMFLVYLAMKYKENIKQIRLYIGPMTSIDKEEEELIVREESIKSKEDIREEEFPQFDL